MRNVATPRSLAATSLRVRAGQTDLWGVRYVIGVFLLLRLTLSTLAMWLLSLRSLHMSALIRAQYLGQAPLHDPLAGPWQRFDAFWYLRLATQGYGAHDGSTVYFPLYPLFVKVVALPLLGHTMLAALLVSNACCVGFLLVLHRLVAESNGIAAARRTILLLSVFPTAFFLLGAYTESLFLLCVAGSFLAAGRDRWLLAGLLGFFAALTRLQGVVLALPLLWLAVESWRAADTRREIGQHWGGRWPGLLPGLAAVGPPLGAGLFLLYVHVVVRAGLVTSVYTHQVHQQLGLPWTTLGSYVAALTAHHWRLFSFATGNWVDALNVALALGVLALVLPARRIVGTPLWLYALATWAATLCIHQSTARYMLTIFPAFITLAVWAPGRRTAQLALLVGAPLMLFMAGEFVLWSFVG